MGWSGVIPEGYGKGQVNSVFSGNIDILKSSPEQLEFVKHEGTASERFLLKKNPKSEKDEWLFYNYTPTRETKVYKNVPDYKKSYKKLKKEILESDAYKNNPDKVFAPKYDGAHNLIVLRPNKAPDIFSYRRSKRTGRSDLIDHTYKTELFKSRSPADLGETILRAEVFSSFGKSKDTARLLNSSTPKSRESQKQAGKPLEIRAFDVVRFNSRDTENLPMGDKLEILKAISEKFPEIKIPELAETPEEKEKLFERIESGNHPHTDEGLVVFDKKTSTPEKYKIEDDYDAEITGVFPATPGSKYGDNAIGGFIVRPEGSDQEIRVGTGIDDETRREAYSSPEKFIGEWAEIKSQYIHESGMHQAPVFKGLRIEKMDKVGMDKTALNALKARQLAKKVGIIPEAKSQ